jgi:hypothetical protein
MHYLGNLRIQTVPTFMLMFWNKGCRIGLVMTKSLSFKLVLATATPDLVGVAVGPLAMG